MLETELLSDKNSTRVTFSGDLSVAGAADLQQQLLKTSWETAGVKIIVENVENMDLSFLQLLFAWSKTLKSSGKNLNFDFRLGDEFQRIVEESGFGEVFDQL
jgi:anti-anti-sigma regulatory factor